MRRNRIGPPAPLADGLGGAVDYLSPLEPWQSPQWLPGSPHNLPSNANRLPLRLRNSSNGSELIGGAIPGTGPTTPGFGDSQAIREAHRYANIIAYYNAVPLTSVAPIITESLGLRNFLSIRNPSVAANIYVAFGTPADANSPIALVPGQTILFDTVVPQNDIFVIADAAAGFVSIGYSTIPG